MALPPPTPIARLYRGIKARVAQGILALLGWRFHTTWEHDLTRGEHHAFPPKFIVFGEPHTHHLDFVFMLLFFARLQLPKALFPLRSKHIPRGLGGYARCAGALPIDTKKSNGLVEELVERMKAADSMILHIPPSGTRKRGDRWRSGFYHIAQQAQVPIFMAYLDASTKTWGYAPPLYLTGDVRKDMDAIRAFYADKRGFVPANESVIRLREEDEPAAEPKAG